MVVATRIQPIITEITYNDIKIKKHTSTIQKPQKISDLQQLILNIMKNNKKKFTSLCNCPKMTEYYVKAPKWPKN